MNRPVANECITIIHPTIDALGVSTMARELACRDAGYDCDFMIRSEDESQLIEFAQEHLQETHNAEMSETDIRGAWKTV